MASSRINARSVHDRVNLYDQITGSIIAQLEQGRLPWVQPWVASGADPAMPHNGATSRNYSGVNVIILWAAQMAGGYRHPAWLTFRQALAAGGAVRKGEHGVGVVFANTFVPRGLLAAASVADESPRGIPFLKWFTLFNVDQCEGLPDEIAHPPAPSPLAPFEIDARINTMIEGAGVAFHVGGDRAFYSEIADFIRIPHQDAYFDAVNWNRTALHELTHASGAAHRLKRDLTGAFGSTKYAQEELIAELGAAFLCANLGIAPTVRHADYIGSWLDVLRNDNRAIFKAASAASKAADYLLGFADRAIEDVDLKEAA